MNRRGVPSLRRPTELPPSLVSLAMVYNAMWSTRVMEIRVAGRYWCFFFPNLRKKKSWFMGYAEHVFLRACAGLGVGGFFLVLVTTVTIHHLRSAFASASVFGGLELDVHVRRT